MSMENEPDLLNQKPHSQTVRIPQVLMPKIEHRWRDQEYPSITAYIIGLIAFDLSCKRPHSVTAELMRKPQYTRDIILKEICDAYDTKETLPGGWFLMRMKQLAKEDPELLADTAKEAEEKGATTKQRIPSKTKKNDAGSHPKDG